MEQIPDAPYIRDAERNGMPPYDDDPEPVCPVCGKKCETIYTDDNDDVVGCDWCIHGEDAADWYYRTHHEEEEYEY